MPPTEKRGRVHTSTVTVSITSSNLKIDDKYLKRKEDDFRIEWFSGTGKGGMHRNKSSNCCRVIHIPTGTKQERQGRKRENNKRDAFAAVNQILDQLSRDEAMGKLGKERKEQAGSGMRGDKSFTIRFQHDIVICHKNNKSMSAKRYMKGHMDDLWD